MLIFVTGLVAFCAMLVPILAPRYWMVLLAGIVCSGIFALVYWNAMTIAPEAQPAALDILLPAARDGAVYTAFATVLYFIKRLFVSSAPQKPPRH